MIKISLILKEHTSGAILPEVISSFEKPTETELEALKAALRDLGLPRNLVQMSAWGILKKHNIDLPEPK